MTDEARMLVRKAVAATNEAARRHADIHTFGAYLLLNLDELDAVELSNVGTVVDAILDELPSHLRDATPTPLDRVLDAHLQRKRDRAAAMSNPLASPSRDTNPLRGG